MFLLSSVLKDGVIKQFVPGDIHYNSAFQGGENNTSDFSLTPSFKTEARSALLLLQDFSPGDLEEELEDVIKDQ